MDYIFGAYKLDPGANFDDGLIQQLQELSGPGDEIRYCQRYQGNIISQGFQTLPGPFISIIPAGTTADTDWIGAVVLSPGQPKEYYWNWRGAFIESRLRDSNCVNGGEESGGMQVIVYRDTDTLSVQTASHGIQDLRVYFPSVQPKPRFHKTSGMGFSAYADIKPDELSLYQRSGQDEQMYWFDLNDVRYYCTIQLNPSFVEVGNYRVKSTLPLNS